MRTVICPASNSSIPTCKESHPCPCIGQQQHKVVATRKLSAQLKKNLCHDFAKFLKPKECTFFLLPSSFFSIFISLIINRPNDAVSQRASESSSSSSSSSNCTYKHPKHPSQQSHKGADFASIYYQSAVSISLASSI